MPLEPGQLLDGKYRIIRLLGRGGMGEVYEGHHELIDRRIAIKTLLSTVQEQASIVRFEREARAAGRIGNDHILEIYDIGALPDGSRYMVMEFLDGETLSARIERNQRLSIAEVAHVALQLLNGLRAAHDAGVLHRDLKPDNIFLVGQKAGHRDFVKIIDFGISKFNLGNDEMRMTATGMVVGTPYYIAPEVAKGLGEVDHRADLYAVGVILYECLSGQVPFQADNFNNLLFKIVLEEAPHLSTVVPDVDPDLATLVHKAMAREQTHRFQSCAEFAEALQGWAALKGISLGPGEATTAGRASQYSFSDGLATAQLGLGSGTIQAPAIHSTTPGAFGASQPVPLPKKQAPLGLLLGAGGALVALGAVVAVLLAQSGEKSGDESAEQATEESPATQTAAQPAPDLPEPPPAAEPPVTASPAAEKPSEEASREGASTKESDLPARQTAASSTEPSREKPAPTNNRATAAPQRPTPARRAAEQPPAPPTTQKPRRNFGY